MNDIIRVKFSHVTNTTVADTLTLTLQIARAAFKGWAIYRCRDITAIIGIAHYHIKSIFFVTINCFTSILYINRTKYRWGDSTADEAAS